MTGDARLEGFTVLVVCTGNICRSPMGERQIRDALDAALAADAARFTVVSAGTYAGHRGEPMQPGAQQVLAERGISSAGFTATPLTAAALERADLVLTAERSHCTTALRLAPSALARTFTLIEFGRLVDGSWSDAEGLVASEIALADPDPVERARELVRLAAQRRRQAASTFASPSDDIDDPYARPVEAFRRAADEIETAINGWIQALAASP